MPLGDQSFRAGNVARLKPPASPEASSPDSRINDLEARLDRLESGHLTALHLVRQALTTLKDSQDRQRSRQDRALARLAAQLGECEAALAGLETSRKQDDEAMRERLFAMGEMLEVVRAKAARAVRPAALHKLERTLSRDIETSAGTLRAEFAEQITDAVEAAEARSAAALDTLEDHVWDDIIEIARRFDCLADTVVKVRQEAERSGNSETAASAAGNPEQDREGREPAPAEEMTAHDIITFPTQALAGRDPEEAPEAASEKAEQTHEPGPEKAACGTPAAPHGFRPLGRIVSRAGSAAIAVSIIGGLSLLAGPVLGPNLQGTSPAFAQNGASPSPVMAEPLPISLTPHLTPVLRTDGEGQRPPEDKDTSSGR